MELKEIQDKQELFHIVKQIYTDAEKERECIEQLIDVVHGHTMLAALIGILLEFGLHEPSYILEQLERQRASFDSEEEIELEKDGRHLKETYYRHLRTLVALFLLDEQKQELLRALSFIPLSGIEDRLFADWMQQRNMNQINDLVELGLVQRDRHILSLHPMIQEVAVADLKPSVTNSGVLMNSLHNLCLMHGNDYKHYNLLFCTIENMMRQIVQDDISSYLLFIEDAFAYMEKYEYRSGMKLILDELKRILKDTSQGTARDRAVGLMYFARCADSPKKAARLNERAIALLEQSDEPVPTALMMNLYCNLCGNYFALNDIKRAKRAIDQSVRWMELCDTAQLHDRIAVFQQYAAVLAGMGDFVQALSVQKQMAQIIRETISDDCIDYAEVLCLMVTYSLRLGEYENALLYARKAMDIYLRKQSDRPDLIEQNYTMLKNALAKYNYDFPLLTA